MNRRKKEAEIFLNKHNKGLNDLTNSEINLISL